MVNNKIGYACINMQLSYPTKYGNKPKGTQPITTNRSMIKRTFTEKGVDYASELILQNVKDLITSMGFKHIEAQGEADKLCAALVRKNKVYGVLTEDMDLFAYGCPVVFRYISLTNH